jgi:hypothetical protein
MAARRWRENEADGVCRDCRGEIEPKRKADGKRCCRSCADVRAEAERERRRRKRRVIPPPAGEL